jgi:hypothetical protein
VSEWICLWCDWTGGGDATACSQVRGPPPSACGAEDGPRGTDEPEQGRRGWPEPQAGLDGVEVEQEAPAQEETPRVTGVVVGRPEPPVGGTRDRSVEYIIKAAAICETANRRLLAVEETPSFPRDEGAAAVAVLRFSEKSFAKLRALPLPKGGRGRFLAYYSLLERQTLFLRRAATAASAGHTARARRFGWARPPDAPGRWARARATVVPGGYAGVRWETAELPIDAEETRTWGRCSSGCCGRQSRPDLPPHPARVGGTRKGQQQTAAISRSIAASGARNGTDGVGGA